MAKKYFWFKMKEDFFKTKEVKKLRRIAGGDTYTIIYQKLIILSLRNEGKLFFDGIEESFAEEIALEIDEEVDNVKATLVFLVKFGLVDQMSEVELVVSEAVKNIGTESESAERVRLHRERKNVLALQCNGQVTKCNTEIEKDLELEKEKDIYIVSDDRIDWFAQCYLEHTGNKYRKTKKDIDWNCMLEGISKDEFVELVYDFFEDDRNTLNQLTVEYFNTVVDRYR